MDIAGELSPFNMVLKLHIQAYSGEIFEKGPVFPRTEFYYPTLVLVVSEMTLLCPIHFREILSLCAIQLS